MTSLKLAELKKTVSEEASGESPCGCRRCKVFTTESLRQKDRAEISSIGEDFSERQVYTRRFFILNQEE